MFKKVILATDFSPCAEQLYSCLPELKKLGAKEVILLHIVPLTPPARHVEEAKERLMSRKPQLEEMGFAVSVTVRVGHAPQEINRVAARYKADLILVGARGENRIRDVFLGNTVRDLIRTSKTPMLVEKFIFDQGKCQPASPEKLKRLLLPVDFSDASMRVFALIKDRWAAVVDEALLVHVVDSGHTEEQVAMHRSEAADRLNAMRQTLADEGIKTEVLIEIGTPFIHIIEAAHKKEATMVVLATRGAGNIKELLLGSTAENVARKSRIPVLLYPDRK